MKYLVYFLGLGGLENEGGNTVCSKASMESALSIGITVSANDDMTLNTKASIAGHQDVWSLYLRGLSSSTRAIEFAACVSPRITSLQHMLHSRQLPEVE